MSFPAANPRRRPARADDPSLALVDSFQTMSIRKGETFHPKTDTSQSSFWDPLEARARSPAMPLRSTTSPKSLEELLIGAGERRVVNLLNRVDKAVAAKSKHALANVLNEPEVLPVPTLVIDDGESGPRPLHARHNSHSSDSGIGSSLADSTELGSDSTAKNSIATATPNSDTQSLSSISDAAEEERGLSKYAADQIHRHIVEPILREESLKEFHDLVRSVPDRIDDKEVKNLRELEKLLCWLAPEYSPSPAKYLHFCERTIRVLHTTVTTLHESDQRGPQDRPYSQAYFLDLVGQIRRYAAILAATRARQQVDDEKSDMRSEKDTFERVSLHGGISHNGKPAELVRHTADGKIISLATDEPVTEDELPSSAQMKRSADADLDDDALRSMARRKKNAKPEIHTCELCQKEFKRPCDLTKHVKTHERPWKCPEEDCKYHEFGWPTEKERDRHVNDKHSSTPSLYHCLFKPCPYTSKRESNCKQHMEKAHNWTYVRSKSNGKGRASSVVRLPEGSIPASPASSMLTPLTPIAPSPSTWSDSSSRGSMPPPPPAVPSDYGTPAFAASDFAAHFNMSNLDFNFNDMSNFPTLPITPAMSEDLRDSASLSSHSELLFDGSSFDGNSPADFAFDNYDFSMPADFQSYTPNSSIAGPSSNAMPHVSPQMDQTFTDDAMNVDSGFDDYSAAPNGDFTLFASAPAATGGHMFPSLASNQPTWNNFESNFTSGSHLENQAQPHAPNDQTSTNVNTNAILEELFPGIANQP